MPSSDFQGIEKGFEHQRTFKDCMNHVHPHTCCWNSHLPVGWGGKGVSGEVSGHVLVQPVHGDVATGLAGGGQRPRHVQLRAADAHHSWRWHEGWHCQTQQEQEIMT